MKKPNVVFIFADQWRAQATGYAGDPNAYTPNLDKLAQQSVNFTTAVSGCPVCSPARASLLTGQYPLTHGVFLNDVYLKPEAPSIADVLKKENYNTAYIGKWHLDGHGCRSEYIPPERRKGFDYWKVLECTHAYNNSPYYDNNSPEKIYWDGYDAAAQTDDACEYISNHSSDDNPFVLFLSWGPPHNPFDTAPEKYKKMFSPEKIILRPNVPKDEEETARRDLAGYYAHIAALDEEIGKLMESVNKNGIEEDTIFVFWSDHGDMVGSQGLRRKQHPWDESILVPFLLRYPRLGLEDNEISAPINSVDIMPTLLGLCGVKIPETVEGSDFSDCIKGRAKAPVDTALLACYHNFSEFIPGYNYRGVRTERYTYVIKHEGPYALFDNKEDPYQMKNLVNFPEYAELQKELAGKLDKLLEKTNDKFETGPDYIKHWEYTVTERGHVPYTN